MDMTQATRTAALLDAERALFAEPRALGDVSRASKIAAIYAFAHWLLEHPECPAPTRITATWWTHVADEPDEQTRIAGITSVAEQLGERVIGEPTKVMMFVHSIATEGQHGVGIDYQGAVTTDTYERDRERGRF